MGVLPEAAGAWAGVLSSQEEAVPEERRAGRGEVHGWPLAVAGLASWAVAGLAASQAS